MQGQLDGHTSIPKAAVARTTKWKRNARRQAELSRTAADILDVSDLHSDPTSYTLKMLCNGQEIWVPLGRGVLRVVPSWAFTTRRPLLFARLQRR